MTDRLSDFRLAQLRDVPTLVTFEEVSELADKLIDLRAKLAEHEHTFDLRWKATQRAIKRWQEANPGNDLWPDHADLCVWLMEQLAAGPVMPEVPSEGVLSAAATAEYVGGSPIECFYHAFRDALAAEQKERDR